MRKEYYENINLDEYENIDVSLDEVKKHKMKKDLREKVAQKARLDKKKYIVAASLAIIMSMGIITQPVVAENIPFVNKIYDELGFGNRYDSISKYVGKTVEKNGIKITIDKLLATEKIIKIAVKIESEEEIFNEPTDIITITGGLNGIDVGSGGSSQNIDTKTQIQVLNLMSQSGFPSEGELKLNIYSEKHNLNESMSLDVDFKDSFKENHILQVKNEAKTNNGTVVSIEANGSGSIIAFKGVDTSKYNRHLLKLDNKLYEGDSAMGDSTEYIQLFDATYEEVKNAKNISLIEIIKQGEKEFSRGITLVEDGEDVYREHQTQEEIAEMERLYEEDVRLEEEKRNSLNMIVKDNVEYISEIPSINGDIVNINILERKDGKIKVFINGENENSVRTVGVNATLFDEDRKLAAFPSKIEEKDNGIYLEFEEISNGKIKLETPVLHKQIPIYNEIELNIK